MYKNCKSHAHAGHCGTGFGPSFYGNRFSSPYGSGFKRPKFNVPMNISETENSFIVEVFATGFSKEQITLKVTDDILYISGKKEISEEPNFIRQEFPVKVFERSLFLNGQADIEQISAKSEHEVLIISIPKTEEAKRTERKIDVN